MDGQQIVVWAKDVQEKAQPSLEFPKFSIFRQLWSIQKYIYTWSLQKILDVLKSYESESFISAGLSLVA